MSVASIRLLGEQGSNLTFIDSPELWPLDITGKHIFLLKAIQSIGPAFSRKDMRLPSAIYRYEFELPDFLKASEDDKQVATDIIHDNEAEFDVDITEEYFYSDYHEKSYLMRNAHISEHQWNQAKQIIRQSAHIPIETIDNAMGMASAIFQGVASANIMAVQRDVGHPKFTPLPAETFNIDSDAIIKARLALGRINPDRPFDLNPRGSTYVFLESKSFQKWRNDTGGSTIRISIARRNIMRLAESHDNLLPSSLKKENLLDRQRTSFDLSDSEKEHLWNSLPDKPFKMPGLRPGASRKGMA